MKHMRNGFTMVEVTLFLALTSLLLTGIIGMAQTSIAQQRNNDAVQNFIEFLRTVYSEVSNPQSIGDGRSEEYAIYGKLVTFGERKRFDGTDVLSEVQEIFVYDVIGDADGRGSGSAASTLASAGANVLTIIEKNGTYMVDRAGIVQSYYPKWRSVIDSTVNGEPFKGSILIVRNPRSGLITTLINAGQDGVIEVNEAVANWKDSGSIDGLDSLLIGPIVAGGFKTEQVDFCVNMNGYGKESNNRRDVRIIAGARNASGVELIDLDSEDNLCMR